MSLGRKVEGEELKKILGVRAEREALIGKLRTESRELKPGDCLAFETTAIFAFRSTLGLITTPMKGEFVIEDDGHKEVYLYRVK